MIETSVGYIQWKNVVAPRDSNRMWVEKIKHTLYRLGYSVEQIVEELVSILLHEVIKTFYR